MILQSASTLVAKRPLVVFTALLILLSLLTNCHAQDASAPRVISVPAPAVTLGIDVLAQSGFASIRGKRVGLITNPTGVNHDFKSTIDILFGAEDVNLVALYGPEHGVRADARGGELVGFYTDPATKLPVYSLYGKTRKPTKDMLAGIDVLIYDIQDIGTRSYTFISTMGLAMEAASENNIEFIVLDRPNPLGGLKIEGSIAEPEYFSFISQYPIPYVYGLTCGELALFLAREKMVKTKEGLTPTIIPMQGWKRHMNFEATGLNWISTSAHIPHQNSAYFYPMTGILGELRSAISIGVGFTLPFQLIGAEWIDGHALAKELNAKNLAGLHFRALSFAPYYGFGEGSTLHGVQIHITDFEAAELVAAQFHVLYAIKKLYPKRDLFSLATKAQIGMFNKAVGSARVYEMYQTGAPLSEILAFLGKDADAFRETSKAYYLYE